MAQCKIWVADGAFVVFWLCMEDLVMGARAGILHALLCLNRPCSRLRGTHQHGTQGWVANGCKGRRAASAGAARVLVSVHAVLQAQHMQCQSELHMQVRCTCECAASRVWGSRGF